MQKAVISMEEYEKAIRADERAKYDTERLEIMKKQFIQRIAGLLLIFGSIMMVAAGWTYDEVTQCYDGTILMLMIPLGLYLVLSKNICYGNY